MKKAKNGKFQARHNQSTDESGSSGQIDAEMPTSQCSSAPMRKCVSLDYNKRGIFDVPMQVLSVAQMPLSKREAVLSRLKSELEQIRNIKKRANLLDTNVLQMTSSKDIFSSSNQTKKNNTSLRQFSSKPEKKTNVQAKVSGEYKRISEELKSTKQGPKQSSMNLMLIKECETLLKRLMTHQHSWAFNTPVDVVKLNIPDYFSIIKHPMDFGTIKGKIGSGAYSNPLQFANDVRLTFKNAMTYNPKENYVHFMADTLGKFFEVRWKNIEKKIQKSDPQNSAPRSDAHKVFEPAEPPEVSPPKKRKVTAEMRKERAMSNEEKQNMARELESLLSEPPARIINFLKEHGSNGEDIEEDEIEIDIDALSVDALFSLRKLLDEYLQEKACRSRGEPCEIELLNESGPSSSSMQLQRDNEAPDEDVDTGGADEDVDIGGADEDVDIGGDDPPISYPHVEIEKDVDHNSCKSSSYNDTDSGGSSETECDAAAASTPIDSTKVPVSSKSGAQLAHLATARNPSRSGAKLDQLEQTSQREPCATKSDNCQDDETPKAKQTSSDKAYRAALLKGRFADTILKAREKTQFQSKTGDLEKLKREKDELEAQRRKEKARLKAEAKNAEDARRRVEAEEARRKLEVKREAARQKILEMEKTVEIDVPARLLEDFGMGSSVGETSPDMQEEFGGFKFGSGNPLEQLGLFIKDDEEYEDGMTLNVLDPEREVEEGEID